MKNLLPPTKILHPPAKRVFFIKKLCQNRYYHSVIPSEVEGSQDWLSEMFRLRFATLNMTDYTLMK